MLNQVQHDMARIYLLYMTIKPIETEQELEQAKAIRRRVFVEEQHCPPDEEWDQFEETSRHIVGLMDGRAVATARWRTVAYGEETVAKLERFAVLPEYRGRGLGRELVVYVMNEARDAGFGTQLLHAQAHLQEFYESFGFEAAGDMFVEAGIPHVRMIRKNGDIAF
jgi:predicted GNAT family N-acyltransferase